MDASVQNNPLGYEKLSRLLRTYAVPSLSLIHI